MLKQISFSAIEQLNKILANTKFSSIHKTKAAGFEGDDFLNLVVSRNLTLVLMILIKTKRY